MHIIDQELKFGALSKLVLDSLWLKEMGFLVPNLKKLYSQSEVELIATYYKAINLLYSILNRDEFECISSCTSTQEIWEKLIITNKDTNQVKEPKISTFSCTYELFTMAPNKTIK